MEFDSNILTSMVEYERFEEVFIAFVKETAGKACLFPRCSKPRLYTAHYAWCDDLSRVRDRENNLGEGLDHFKQCGHLAYWLRRSSPVVEYDGLAALWEKPGELYPNEIELRDCLYSYGDQFLAFDLGFQICQYYEYERMGQIEEATFPIRLSPTPTICIVSPWTAGKGRRRRIEEAIRLILDCSENRTGV